MKIGFDTTAWGERIDDLESALDTIASAGYQGVEFAQRPEQLGNIDTLLHLLYERGLILVGLRGGSLLERMMFCGRYRDAYLTIYHWHPYAQVAVDKNFNLALHPHIAQPKHRLADVRKLLAEHPKLKFLADTALLKIAGDDPVQAIQEILQVNQNQLTAVHLKDWRPEFGRSSHRYARGFTELGKGETPIEEVLDQLRAAKYNAWVIVGQERPHDGPYNCAFTSAEWLRQKELLSASPKTRFAQQRIVIHSSHTRTQGTDISFLKAVIPARTEDLSKFYQRIVSAFRSLVPSHLVTVWMCNPVKDLMSLLAVDPLDATEYIDATTKFDNSLGAIAVERQMATRFNLMDEQPGAPWGDPSAQFTSPVLNNKFSLSHMISIPILSDSNPQYARLLVEIFPQDEQVNVTDEDLSRLSTYVAIAADSALDDRCSYAAAKTNIAAAKSNIAAATATLKMADIEQVQDFLVKFRDLIQQFLNCQFVSIFLVNEVGNRLELAVTNTEITWPRNEAERFYTKGEGLTGKVWETKEAILSTDPTKEPGHKGKSEEPTYGKGTQRSYLCSPLIDHTGEVVGVVRCHNKNSGARGDFNMFTYDDVAIIDAIGQAAAPHVQLLRSNERHAKALNRLTHELKHPLVAIQAATGRMRSNLKRRNISVDSIFDHDYIKNNLS